MSQKMSPLNSDMLLAWGMVRLVKPKSLTGRSCTQSAFSELEYCLWTQRRERDFLVFLRVSDFTSVQGNTFLEITENVGVSSSLICS